MDYPTQYYGTIPTEEIVVDAIYTVHYFENYRNYFFPGERHDFWEILYVDRGEIVVETDRLDAPVRLKQGDLIMHRPNEFHRFYANNITPHNLFVISFQSTSPAMAFFDTHVLFHARHDARADISRIVTEAKRCFDISLQDSAVERLIMKKDAPFAGVQIIKLTLELMLLKICRGENTHTDEDILHSKQEEPDKNYVDKAIGFLQKSLKTKIMLEDVCAYLGVSRSQLQKMFLLKTGRSVMQYLRELRIEEAKYMIRQKNANFTEISEQLCYSTIHHFSRQFKEIAGMSPTEYADSIYALTERVEPHSHHCLQK
ncbi:MAG: AraC family transcriptional regulator [Ruthenibacterium sp.]